MTLKKVLPNIIRLATINSSKGNEREQLPFIIATERIKALSYGKGVGDKANHDFILINAEKGVYAVVDGIANHGYSFALGARFIRNVEDALKSWDGLHFDRFFLALKPKILAEAKEMTRSEAEIKGGIVFKICHWDKVSRKLIVVGNGDVEIILMNEEGGGMLLEPMSQNGTGLASETLITEASKFKNSNALRSAWGIPSVGVLEYVQHVTVDDSITHMAIMSDGVAEQLWVGQEESSLRYPELQIAMNDLEAFKTIMMEKQAISNQMEVLEIQVLLHGKPKSGWDPKFHLETVVGELLTRLKESGIQFGDLDRIFEAFKADISGVKPYRFKGIQDALDLLLIRLRAKQDDCSLVLVKLDA